MDVVNHLNYVIPCALVFFSQVLRHLRWHFLIALSWIFFSVYHLESKFQCTESCLLLLMNLDTLHTDLYTSLSMHYTRPITVSCSLYFCHTQLWVHRDFLPLACRNLICHTSIFILCFMVALILVVMPHTYVINIKDVFGCLKKCISLVNLCLQLSQCFHFSWFTSMCTLLFGSKFWTDFI